MEYQGAKRAANDCKTKVCGLKYDFPILPERLTLAYLFDSLLLSVENRLNYRKRLSNPNWNTSLSFRVRSNKNCKHGFCVLKRLSLHSVETRSLYNSSYLFAANMENAGNNPVFGPLSSKLPRNPWEFGDVFKISFWFSKFKVDSYW